MTSVAASVLIAAAAALEAQALALRALASRAQESTAPADDLLGLPELKRRYGLGRGTVLAAVDRGELEASRGARGAILVRHDVVESWLHSRPVKPRQRDGAANDLTDWDARVRADLDRLAVGASR